ncbi:hypothetical protein TWF730_009142 [Orbilia blumenaviensis]|uniref:Ankyrin repeat protein n=1 Tax=Orbilia blumenaviensis TaxID=1796055 RepID=A0AAV9UXG1_9PEZI
MTAFNPESTTTHCPIPTSFISKLPCAMLFKFLVQICIDLSQQNGRSLGDLLNSKTFRHLWRLLYLVSNNFLSWIELDQLLDDIALSSNSSKELMFTSNQLQETPFIGDNEAKPISNDVFASRQSLKSLLSMKTVSVESFAENLLPLLILRQDEDMLSHIFLTHGTGSITIKWYTGLLEIDLKQSMGYFFKIDEDPQYFYHKYGSQPHGHDYFKSLRQFLLKGIKTYMPVALTAQEAAALISYTIHDGNISLESMALLFLDTLTLSDVEEQYELLYGTSVLDSPSKFTMEELLRHGFRRNIHIIALEAVIKNSYHEAVVLLPRTRLDLSNTPLEGLGLGALCSIYGNVWDFLGKDKMRQLIILAEEEARDPTCKRKYLHPQDILSISFRASDLELADFTMDLFITYPELHGLTIESLLMGSIVTMDLPNSSLNLLDLPNPSSSENSISKAELLHNLSKSKYQQRLRNYDISSPESLNRQLHSAVWERNLSSTRFLIGLGADPNAENSLHETPLITAILKERDDNFEEPDLQLIAEVSVFFELIVNGADVGRLENFEIEMDGYQYQVNDHLVEAANNWEKDQITKLWEARFVLVSGIPVVGSDSAINTEIPSLYWVGLPYSQLEPTETYPGSADFGTGRDNDRLHEEQYESFDWLQGKIFQMMRDLESLNNQTCSQYRDSLKDEEVRRLLGRPNCRRLALEADDIEGESYASTLTLLQYLSAFGSVDLLDYFFQSYPEEARMQIKKDYSSTTSPLQVAAAYNHFECLKFLVKKGSNPREKVQHSVWEARLFKNSGIKNIGRGMTCLHYAVQYRNFEMVLYLVEHGADIGAKKSSFYPGIRDMHMSQKPSRRYEWKDGDMSVLKLAIINGQVDCVSLFLTKRPDAVIEALNIAMHHRQTRIQQLIRNTWNLEIALSHLYELSPAEKEGKRWIKSSTLKIRDKCK